MTPLSIHSSSILHIVPNITGPGLEPFTLALVSLSMSIGWALVVSNPSGSLSYLPLPVD